MARRIARKVVQERERSPIDSTVRMAEVVRSAVPAARSAGSSIHPATRTFQALRIAVNDEIGSLERLLESVQRSAAMAASGKTTWLAPGARIGIISFHSLEDRPVKRAFSGSEGISGISASFVLDSLFRLEVRAGAGSFLGGAGCGAGEGAD